MEVRHLIGQTAWDAAGATLEGFGGDLVTLHLAKTGLPFFDALRLYGAIDLFIGVREDVSVSDDGTEWTVAGRSRPNPLRSKFEAAFHAVWDKKKPLAAEYHRTLREKLTTREAIETLQRVTAKGEWDPVLQTGVRDTSAYAYETLQSGQTSRRECKTSVALSDAVLAHAGGKRIDRLGDITFLPIFQGQIDLSKVVSPLRARLGLPNVLCAQALVLLMLKTSLFAEGYQERLHAVAFRTNLNGNRSDNYSGIVSLDSTALRRVDSAEFVELLLRSLRELVKRGWQRQGRDYHTTEYAQHALAMAQWILQPNRQHLSTMIGSQERLRAQGGAHIFTQPGHVWRVFSMSYGDWNGDREAVRRFARTVSSAIYQTRMRKESAPDERNKAWYDEVTMLRSAPSARAFIERALILIEQGHRDSPQVGTTSQELFDPSALLGSAIGDRADFETFRDLFRMYLVQESRHRDLPDDMNSKDSASAEEGGEGVPE